MGNRVLEEKLKFVSKIKKYPSVTILMPLNETGLSAGAYNPQKTLSDLIRDAKQKIHHAEKSGQSEIVLNKLDQLEEKVRYEDYHKGLCIFISEEVEEIIPVPFEVEKNVYVNNNFQVRDLVFAMNRLDEYLVILLSEKKILTLKGSGLNISVIDIPEMPKSINDLGSYDEDVRFTNQHTLGGGHLFVQQGQQEDNVEKLKNYIIKLDHALGKFLKEEKTKVVLVGVEKNLGHYKSYGKHNDKIIATINGNYESAPTKTIAEMVWPVVKNAVTEEKAKTLQDLDRSVGANTYASGITSVWQAAVEGRVRTLIVEKNYQCTAVALPDGYSIDLEASGSENTGELMEDAVDDLIELVLSKDGNIVFVENGTLEQHQQIAAITRY